MIGGGMLETFAFGGSQNEGLKRGTPSPNELQNLMDAVDSSPRPSKIPVSVPVPEYPFELLDAIAISSLAGAEVGESLNQGISEYMQGFSMQFTQWPVPSKQLLDATGVTVAEIADNLNQYLYSDGGFADNLAVIPMLKRGATKIASFLATGEGLHKTQDFCTDQSGEKATWAAYDLVALFHPVTAQNSPNSCPGYWTPCQPHNQVFPSADLAPLLCEFQKKVTAGEPAVVKASHILQDNAWWGITGNQRQVDVIWYYPTKIKSFEKRLEATDATRSTKNKLIDGTTFPYLKTDTKLDRPSLTLLAAQVQYAVMENRALYEELFRSP